MSAAYGSNTFQASGSELNDRFDVGICQGNVIIFRTVRVSLGPVAPFLLIECACLNAVVLLTLGWKIGAPAVLEQWVQNRELLQFGNDQTPEWKSLKNANNEKNDAT